MKELENLIERILLRINTNLRELDFKVDDFVRRQVSPARLNRFYAFYGLTADHPLYFYFNNSSLDGSYFLGKCSVSHSILYKSDIRGDELKSKGEIFNYEGIKIPVHDDEIIKIKDSLLVKTLVHNFSHDPESLEEFTIQNTASMPYANIHGAPVEGSFLGAFSTIDLTTVHDCVIGEYAYVQVGELSHANIKPGQVWVRAGDDFEFKYQYPARVLQKYLIQQPGREPEGILMDFVESRKEEFSEIFETVQSSIPIPGPKGSYLSRYAVVKGDTSVGQNVLAVERAYLENAWLGKGANVQENCYIIASRLEGLNVTAHGGKIIDARLGEKVFVGFNSFLRGNGAYSLEIGPGCIVMPHTIIDAGEPVTIPKECLVWGYIQNQKDLNDHIIPLDELSRVEGEIKIGRMRFKGGGSLFVKVFKERIEHILEANGAYYGGLRKDRGHAQKNRITAYNNIRPYPAGPLKGIYPSMEIIQPIF